VSEITHRCPGTVSAVNELLTSATETVNTDPYGEGWICEITTSDSSDFDELLDPRVLRRTHQQLAPTRNKKFQ